MQLEQEEKEKALKILRSLYIDREDRTLLNFTTPYEMLVATILSAQCTDDRVNKVTSELFKNYNTPEAMVTLTEEQLQEMIKSCGLAKAKSRNIINASKKLIEEFNSEVPKTHEEILTLPGVGRKTANVVLANAYGIPGIGVDTHVQRVSTRLGLADANTADKVEFQLREAIPEDYWNKAHHWLIWHGRKVCKSRKPLCESCPVSSICQYNKNTGGT